MDPSLQPGYDADGEIAPEPPPEPKPVPPPPPREELVLPDGRTVADVARENAFLRANVDLDSKVGQLMLRSYEGPITVEAISSEAQDLGCLRMPRSEPGTPPSEEATERSNFAHGAEPSTTLPQKHPHDAAREAGTKVLMEGGTTEDAIRAGFGMLVESAIRGDERVLVREPPAH